MLCTMADFEHQLPTYQPYTLVIFRAKFEKCPVHTKVDCEQHLGIAFYSVRCGSVTGCGPYDNVGK